MDRTVDTLTITQNRPIIRIRPTILQIVFRTNCLHFVSLRVTQEWTRCRQTRWVNTCWALFIKPVHICHMPYKLCYSVNLVRQRLVLPTQDSNEALFELIWTQLMLTLELNNSFLGFSAQMIIWCFGGCFQIVPKDEKNVSEVRLKTSKTLILFRRQIKQTLLQYFDKRLNAIKIIYIFCPPICNRLTNGK